MIISKFKWAVRALFVQSIVLTLVLAASTLAADGDLDPSFAGNGKTHVAFANVGFAIGTTVAVQPDGKILVAGVVADINADSIVGVARYNVDGSLDSTFGNNGLATVDFYSFYLWKVDVVLQGDGKILLGGAFAPLGQNPDMGIARLNSDGTLDATFGSGGKFTCDFNGWNDGVTSLAIQPDGKIVAGGYASSPVGDFDFAAIRVNSNGTLDTNFGTAGKILVNFFGAEDRANGVALQQDGKIVLAGTAWGQGSTESDYAIVRLNSDGTLDAGFGSAGKTTINFIAHDEGNAVAIQPDGKIVVGGSAGADSLLTSDFGILRLDPNGALDGSFGTGGKTTTDFFGALDHVYDLLIQPDGKIVAAGDINPNDLNVELYVDFGLARYDTSGVLDPTFGNGGKVSTDFGFADYGGGVAFTPDCKIVASGFTWQLETGGTLDFAVARYNSSGCIVEPPPTGSTCPRTHGYWKTHPESWPIDSMMLGSQTYDKTELLSILGLTSNTDASITLARQLIAAKLNIASGSNATPLGSVISDSDVLLSLYGGKLPYKVKTSSANGQAIVANATILTNYNAGLLTPVCTQ